MIGEVVLDTDHTNDQKIPQHLPRHPKTQKHWNQFPGSHHLLLIATEFEPNLFNCLYQ